MEGVMVRRNRDGMIAQIVGEFMNFMNDRMIYPKFQQGCCVLSLIIHCVSIGLLYTVKPFMVFKDNPTLLSITLVVLWPLLTGYVRFCRFLETTFFNVSRLSTYRYGVLHLFIGTFMTVSLATAGAYLTDSLDGTRALLGTLLFLIAISLTEIWLLQEQDIFLADSVFNVLLGVACVKFEKPWYMVIAILTYCVRRAILFYLKQSAARAEVIEQPAEEPAEMQVAFDPTDLMRLLQEAENSLEAKEYYNEEEFEAFTTLAIYIRTRFGGDEVVE